MNSRQRDEAGIKEYRCIPMMKWIRNRRRCSRVSSNNREVEWAAFNKRRRGDGGPRRRWILRCGRRAGFRGIMVSRSEETVFYTAIVSFGDQTILKWARRLRT